MESENKNLMQEMREKYYPYDKQSQNLIETLDMIKEEMERGCSYIELYDFWCDLPDDWVVDWDTLKSLKEQGFRIVKRWWNKGKSDEYYTIIVSWDDYEEYTNDEEW